MVFMDIQMSKIGCVNYARFPKSGHIYIYTHIFISKLYICIHDHWLVESHAVGYMPQHCKQCDVAIESDSYLVMYLYNLYNYINMDIHE